MIIIIMGVSGCGKTSVGISLSKRTNLPFYDADDFHNETNIEKMKNSIPLDDEDRKPWLTSLSSNIKEWESKGGAILACSALKETYRNILSSKTDKINWVYLSGSFNIIKNRLEQRSQHYMKSNLLKSQFDTLEIPNYGLHISIEAPVNDIVSSIMTKLNIDE